MEIFIFFLVCLYFFISSLGFGMIFVRLINVDLSFFKPIEMPILGLIFLTLISYVSIFFLPHSGIFNLLIHLIGFFYSIKKFFKIKFKKLYLLIISVLFIGILVSKNHDDFSYYHLQQIVNLVQNKFQIGLANLELSYAHHSSILYLKSLFYLPIYQYYFINVPNFIFYTSFVIFFFQNVFDKNNSNFFKIFSLFTIIYFLTKFSRLSEFGTDIMGQFCIVYFYFYLIKYTYYFDKKNNLKNEFQLTIISIIIVYCITIKTYFLIYSVLFLLIFLKINFKEYLFFLFKKKFLFLCLFSMLFLLFLINLLTTGCLIYPVPSLCFENLLWSMKIKDVIEYSIWYEVWAKSLAGAGYRVENYQDLINNFDWLKIWINKYFFNKVTDNLFLLIFIIFVLIITIRPKNKKIVSAFNLNIFFCLSLLVLILLIWFLKFPQLRYGGYSVIFLIFASSIAIYYSQFSNISKKYNRHIMTLIFISFSIFLIKNSIRIYGEFERNDEYKFNDFPFFYVQKNLNFTKHEIDDLIYVYNPVGPNNCWDIPAPCPARIKNLKAKKKFNFIIFYKDE